MEELSTLHVGVLKSDSRNTTNASNWASRKCGDQHPWNRLSHLSESSRHWKNELASATYGWAPSYPELDAGRDELARQAEQCIDGQLTRLDRLLASKEQEVAAKLNLGDQDLAQLSRQLASRAGPSSEMRLPKLPGVDLFRR